MAHLALFHVEQSHLSVAASIGPLRSQIMRTEMSEGETPEIREAWPNVAGRIFSSFTLASVRRLGI